MHFVLLFLSFEWLPDSNNSLLIFLTRGYISPVCKRCNACTKKSRISSAGEAYNFVTAFLFVIFSQNYYFGMSAYKKLKTAIGLSIEIYSSLTLAFGS